MNYRGYAERDLVSNRSSLLIFGGAEADRRAWAEEAAQNFEGEGPVQLAASDAELLTALKLPRGVIYVPDITAIGTVAQGEVVRVLRNREERPKVVIGLSGSPDVARDQGRIRTDLHYALSMAQVNLDDGETKDGIRTRRAKAAARRPASANAGAGAAKARKAAAPSRSGPSARSTRAATRTPARTAPARKPASKAASKPRKTAKKASTRKSAPRRR